MLSVPSRREMIRRQWQDPHSSFANWYGLGIASGRTGDCDWFGHGGGFPGHITRTAVLPQYGIAISVLTNAVDGWAHMWLGGIIQIFSAFARHGAPTARVRDWTGRWWAPSGALDLVPMGNRVLIAAPAMLSPLMVASEITVSSATAGKIALANGFANHGETGRRKRSRSGKVEEVWLGGTRFVPEHKAVAELKARYLKQPARRTLKPRRARAA